MEGPACREPFRTDEDRVAAHRAGGDSWFAGAGMAGRRTDASTALGELTVQDSRKNRRLAFVAGFCVLAISALQAPEAVAQGAMAAVSAKPDAPAPPANAARPSPGHP